MVNAKFASWRDDWPGCVAALSEARQALAYATDNDMRETTFRLAHNAFMLCYRTGRLPEALEFVTAYGDLAQQLNDKNRQQASYGNQALILKAWGRLEEAMALHQIRGGFASKPMQIPQRKFYRSLTSCLNH